MRVLLAHRCHDEGLDDEAAVALPPGLPWLAASVQAAGHHAQLANLSRLGWKDVERFLGQQSPEIVVLSCETANRRAVSRLLRLVRRLFPGTVNLLVGQHATVMGELLLSRNSAIDAIVLGDAEASVAAACSAISREGRSALKGLPGVLVRGALDPPPEATVPELSDLPVPSVLDSVAGLSPERDLRSILVSRPRAAGGVSVRATPQVAQAMRKLRDEAGLIEFSLVGPGLVADRAFLPSLAKQLAEEKVGAAWDVQAQPHELLADPDVPGDADRLGRALAAAQKAGCRRILIEVGVSGLDSAALESLREDLVTGSEQLRRCALTCHLILNYGIDGGAEDEVPALLGLMRACQPRSGQLVPRQLTSSGTAWEERAARDNLSLSYWLDEESSVILEASPEHLELAEQALTPALRDTTRTARLSPRDLQSAQRHLDDGLWIEMEWGDYRAAHHDPEEAERHFRAAAALEAFNPHPWLRLAGLASRGSSPDIESETAALREVLARLPKHGPTRQRLEEIAPRRRRRSHRPRKPTS